MAIKKALVPHILTAGGTQIGIDQAESDYAGSIGDVVGIKKMPENSTVSTEMSVKEVQAKGLAIRLRVRLANGRSNTLLCAVEKVASARSGLKGKAMNGSTIKTVGIPRKRSRR
jgi:hypothetical protein